MSAIRGNGAASVIGSLSCQGWLVGGFESAGGEANYLVKCAPAHHVEVCECVRARARALMIVHRKLQKFACAPAYDARISERSGGERAEGGGGGADRVRRLDETRLTFGSLLVPRLSRFEDETRLTFRRRSIAFDPEAIHDCSFGISVLQAIGHPVAITRL